MLSGKNETFIIKATYNSTSGKACVFVNGKMGNCSPDPISNNTLVPTINSMVIFGAMCPSQNAQAACSDFFLGALEEIYIKNVSCENRHAYLFADDNRRAGTFLIDLTRCIPHVSI